MLRGIRDIRLIPVALIASFCLLLLTITDLLFDGGHWLAAVPSPLPPPGAVAVVHAAPDAPPASGAKMSWAQEVFGFPGAGGTAAPDGIVPPIDAASAARAKGEAKGDAEAGAKGEADDLDITGSIPAKPAAGKSAGAAAGGAGQLVKSGSAGMPAVGKVILANGVALPSGAKVAILERLEKRREQLDVRARALDIRESLVKAAEKRIAAQLAELKEVKARIAALRQQNREADADRFKALVTMYENMKPRDAAKIFDGLDMPVLLKVVSRIKPRIMADIMAQMTPQIAERLTVEMASKSHLAGADDPAQLPKIIGKPTKP